MTNAPSDRETKSGCDIAWFAIASSRVECLPRLNWNAQHGVVVFKADSQEVRDLGADHAISCTQLKCQSKIHIESRCVSPMVRRNSRNRASLAQMKKRRCSRGDVPRTAGTSISLRCREAVGQALHIAVLPKVFGWPDISNGLTEASDRDAIVI